MATLATIALFITLRLFLVSIGYPSSATAAPSLQLPNSTSPFLESPSSAAASPSQSGSTAYWVANIQRQGEAPFNANPSSYKVFRNVKDFGAAGDGTTDDTDAINTAISSGSRCGQGCDSSTTTPALVYFPPGTYLVSKPIVQYYYTQFVGDAISVPTLKAASSFQGMAVIDSDPYAAGGDNWYTNQNNFYRQVRNFVIDLTGMPASAGAGIHWQVAQATSLQNIRFEMVRGGSNNKQQGIFMDNGSGGFMSDLIFNGGSFGAWVGNQQFTTRNLTFNSCGTAIYMNWNWLWALKSLSINNCTVGIDMTSGTAANQSVGSITVQDSQFANTPTGILTASGNNSQPTTGGTLVIDNVDFSSCPVAVANGHDPVLAGNTKVNSWVQGRAYNTPDQNSPIPGSAQQGSLTAPSKPAALLGVQGAVFERSKPQYRRTPVASFVSVKSKGAKGDGKTDDTAAIQAVLDGAVDTDIIYFDHGDYVVSNTVKVPKDIRITGEVWPVILASGSVFQDQSNPAPVFQIGQPGDQGSAELSDLIFSTAGPQPGAILIEWNVQEASQGSCGMWDVHMRLGGATGTQLQSDKCSKQPNVTAPANPSCMAAHTLLHVTKQASMYLENSWFWVADHELDLPDHSQIDVYNGRGVLVESQGPVWMYGTSSEHSQLYQYQLSSASNVYMSAIQTETPYYQPNPTALTPFTPNATLADPTFANCTADSCRMAWGLRLTNATDVLVYGAGLYSFFDNYDQACLATESCQDSVVDVDGASSVSLYGLSTKAATSMVSTDGATIPQKDNTNGFCSTVALFQDQGK